MPPDDSHPRKIRFGPYELDEAAVELRKHGVSIRLQDQPYEILRALLDRPGEVVSREDLRRRLWPDGTFVDYEQSLNKAVSKLREALCDSADKPRYVETASRRGYRFVGALEVVGPLQPEEPPETPAEAQPAAPRRRRSVWWIGAAVFAGVTVVLLATGLYPVPVPTVERIVQLTSDGLPKGPSLAVDGSRVVYSVVRDGRMTELWEVLANGGEPRRVNLPFLAPDTWVWVCGYSPSAQKMLIGSSKADQEATYWLLGTDGSTPSIAARVVYPSDARLSPDGTRMSLLLHEGLFIQPIGTGKRTTLYSREGLRDSFSSTVATWHPSGKQLAFSTVDNDVASLRLWQAEADGSNLRRMIPGLEEVQLPGAWSRDGKRFYFTSPLAKSDVWVRSEPGLLGWLRQPRVQKLTTSGSHLMIPIADPSTTRRLFLNGSLIRGETQRWNLKTGGWEPFRPGFSGEATQYSPDGKLMVYVDFPGFRLYRSGSDGGGQVELAPGVDAFLPRWSPDGKTIAFGGRKAGSLEPFRVWTVPSAGGQAAPLAAIPGPGMDPTWSPDGSKIVFAPHMDLRPANEHFIQILDLRTGKVEAVPGGEGKYSPRWSPDGSMIAALDINNQSNSLWVYRFDSRQWTLLNNSLFGYPEWSKDSRYIYGGVISPTPQWPQAVRVDVRTKKLELIAPHPAFPMTGIFGPWIGWTPQMEPLCLRDMTTTEIFRIDLDR